MQRAGHVDNLAGLCLYNPTFGYLLWWYCTPGGEGLLPYKIDGGASRVCCGTQPYDVLWGYCTISVRTPSRVLRNPGLRCSF